MKEIATLIELQDVYDGYSVIVYTDGTVMNRWAQVLKEYPDDPTVQRRYRLTQEWLTRSKEEVDGYEG